MTVSSLLRLDALARKFVSLCASLLPFKKAGDLAYLCCEKTHDTRPAEGNGASHGERDPR